VLTLSEHSPDALTARRKTCDDASAQTPCPSYRPAAVPRALSPRVVGILFRPADSETAGGGAADRVMPGLGLPVGTCRVGPRRSGLADFQTAARSLAAIKPAVRANAGFQKQEEVSSPPRLWMVGPVRTRIVVIFRVILTNLLTRGSRPGDCFGGFVTSGLF
jgi:hypothetical protein